MNWNHVWELFKINLLYANPQAVTNLQKRQEKKEKRLISPSLMPCLDNNS